MDYNMLIAHVSGKQDRLDRYHAIYPDSQKAHALAAKNLRVAKRALAAADQCEKAMVTCQVRRMYERAT